MTRRRLLIALIAVGSIAGVLAIVLLANQKPLIVAYHQWRMNAEYNTIFGNPEPAGDGLASFDVTGVDVDAVLARYAHHKERLVKLGVLFHLKTPLPHLRSLGDKTSSNDCSDFVERMWRRFPEHRHYYLASDGTLEVWAPIDQKPQWDAFIAEEVRKPHTSH